MTAIKKTKTKTKTKKTHLISVFKGLFSHKKKIMSLFLIYFLSLMLFCFIFFRSLVFDRVVSGCCGPGGISCSLYREVTPEKTRYLFQASSIWNERGSQGFHSGWRIWNDREICHWNLWKDRKTLTGSFYLFINYFLLNN